MHLFRLPYLRIFILLLSTVSFLSSSSADSPDWFESDVTPESGGVWYRASFELQKPEASRFHVTLTVDGTSSLYVNGQRLLKFYTFQLDGDEYESRKFDITELVRSGKNLIAVEADSPATKVRMGLLLEEAADTTAVRVHHATWKKSMARPPVGWQQTDFNDRDWQAVTPADPATAAMKFAEAKTVEVFHQTSQQRSPFHFVDGDHVVFLGATFFEREQQFGHLEAALTGTLGDRRVTFRNLGWDADTVFADSRGIFDPPAQGYLRMIEHVRAEEPGVIIIGYGQNEALNNKLSTTDFQNQLRRLIDDLSTTGATIVLMSPHSLLPAQRPVPSPSRFNPQIQKITEAIELVAHERSLSFVNLFDEFEEQLTVLDRQLAEQASVTMPDRKEHPDLWNGSVQRWTDNGLHFTDRGYQVAGLAVLQRLVGTTVNTPEITLDLNRKSTQTRFAEVRNIEWPEGDSRSLSFDMRSAAVSCLPVLIELQGASAGVTASESIIAADGNTSSINIPISTAAGETQEAAHAVTELKVPAGQQYRDLVESIVRKNELYFHRWRPQNITYLFGFRKHEQGNNATEIAQFDPFIQKLESQIHSLQTPRWRRITVTLPAE